MLKALTTRVASEGGQAKERMGLTLTATETGGMGVDGSRSRAMHELLLGGGGLDGRVSSASGDSHCESLT